MTQKSLPSSLLLSSLIVQMLCVGGTPVTSPPCTLPGPWDIRCLPGCFLQEESGTCAPCPRGSFMDHANTKHKCLRCRSCNADAGFEEERPCSALANAECRCRPGLHCVSPDCPLCSGQPLCPPGQQPGPPPEATSCIPCPPGSYSDSTSATLPCREHTRCEDSGLRTITNGTETTDTKCEDQGVAYLTYGSILMMVAPLVVLAVLVVVGLCCILHRKGCCKKERDDVEFYNKEDSLTHLQPSNEENDDDVPNVPGAMVPHVPGIQFNVNAQVVQIGNSNRCSVDGHEPGSPVT
ncbi:uncharacterized protein LOC142930473 [Petromyzon marinus]|uniref:uncharacterized protein LOC142930473 n=1 Tax=Petromyzon marinus TaxID=7757 RepID=UPI003F701FF5